MYQMAMMDRELPRLEDKVRDIPILDVQGQFLFIGE